MGWDELAKRIKRPLAGLKVAPYWGCTLLRPREVAIDPLDEPKLFEEFLAALGAELTPFPDATTCCSAYQIVANETAAYAATAKILQSAGAHGVEALALSCPLCEYNLGRRQADVRTAHGDTPPIPTFYFTQLLAIALGLPEEQLGLQFNEESAVEFLRSRNFTEAAATA